MIALAVRSGIKKDSPHGSKRAGYLPACALSAQICLLKSLALSGPLPRTLSLVSGRTSRGSCGRLCRLACLFRNAARGLCGAVRYLVGCFCLFTNQPLILARALLYSPLRASRGRPSSAATTTAAGHHGIDDGRCHV